MVKLNGFSSKERLRTRSEFKNVFNSGKKIRGKWLIIYYVQNSLEHSRMGLSVGKKHGNAPQRNRIKRILREAYRLSKKDLVKDVDMILMPKVPGKIPSLQEVIDELLYHFSEK